MKTEDLLRYEREYRESKKKKTITHDDLIALGFVDGVQVRGSSGRQYEKAHINDNGKFGIGIELPISKYNIPTISCLDISGEFSVIELFGVKTKQDIIDVLRLVGGND